MFRHIRWCSLLLAAAGSAWADVGDLKHVAVQPRRTGRLIASGNRFAKPPSGCGTIHPKAMIATLQSAGVKIVAAVDARDAGARGPDVLRPNFSGRTEFDDQQVVPLKTTRQRPDSFRARFGPTELAVPRGDKTIPVIVAGSYYRGGNFRRIVLRLGTAVQGRCAFGEKVYPIRIVDGTGNFRFADGVSARLAKGRVRGAAGSRDPGGDRVLIDTRGGHFRNWSAIESYFGQPVLVDGRWYDVRLSNNGKQIWAKKTDVKLKKVRVPHDKWSVLLIGTKYVLRRDGGKQPVAVPADRYAAAEYALHTPRGATGRRGQVSAGRSVLYGESVKTFDVRADQTTELQIGAPLTARITARQMQGAVELNLKLTDAAGASVDDLRLPSGRRPTAPKVEIFNDQGQRAYQATLRYG